MSASKRFVSSLLLTLLALPAGAATISSIMFSSNGGTFFNDTIVNNGTSPLGITASTDLAQPFLNSLSDSTVDLSFGSYYAIAFLGSYEMIGPGTISFLLSGVSDPFTEDVTFPDPTAASPVFASFALPDNTSLTIAATGLSADRIAVAADAGGLTPDGAPDAFYLLTYQDNTLSDTPEPATLALFGAGLVILGALHRRHTRQN